ncbi:hypothetical protein [Burkholderia ambifaria]|uniref:hypothetical protein n=1 Tax=Burkholderia ambifaria TaxID=152480 RepID=UPI00158E4F81|nr:hypothetical protein [Burkholderia ambifaria]
MKCVVELTEVEDLSLLQLSVNHQAQDIRGRAAGVLMLASRIKVPVIAERLGMSQQMISGRSHAWRDCGPVTRADDRGPQTEG